MKKIFLILLVITAIASGCDKYEQTLKKIYGTYSLKTYTVNGLDSLNQYYDSLGLSFRFIYDENSYRDVCIMDGPRKDGFSGDLYWGWELDDNKKLINIIAASGTAIGVGPFGINKTPVWEIIQLTKDQMKLKAYYYNKAYLIVLEK